MRRALACSALVLALVAAAGPAPLRAQCSMCQSVVNGSAEGRAMGAELNNAILVMFGAPYLVFGAFVAVALRRQIRERLPQPSSLWSRIRATGRRRPPGRAADPGAPLA